MSSSSRIQSLNKELSKDWRKPIKPLTPDKNMRQPYPSYFVKPLPPVPLFMTEQQKLTKGHNPDGHNVSAWKQGNKEYIHAANHAANGGQINIYTGPKNGKYIIKNGVKVYINSKSLTNNVQYKKKAMPKKR